MVRIDETELATFMQIYLKKHNDNCNNYVTYEDLIFILDSIIKCLDKE